MLRIKLGRFVIVLGFKIRDADGWLIPTTIVFNKNIGVAKLNALTMPLFQVVVLSQIKP